MIAEIAELFFLLLFSIEITLNLISYGPRIYFRNKLYLVDTTFIFLIIAWHILDLNQITSYKGKGAFRAIRVALMIWRLKNAYLVNSVKCMQTRGRNSSDKSLNWVCELLINARDEATDLKLISNLDYCIDIISSKINYKFNEKPKLLKSEDSSSSLDQKIIHNNKLSIEEIKKNIQKDIESYNIEKELNLTPKAIKILEDVQRFEFDIFELHNETNGNEMITLATYLTNKHDLFTKLAIELNTFSNFIKYIQNGYNDVAYHNKIHGIDVGRLAYYYGTSWELLIKAELNDLELFWLILGGAIHDYEHLGWNNTYLIETQHEWAITYNDISVWENHHVAAAFEVMKNRQGWNIFEHTSQEDFK